MTQEEKSLLLKDLCSRLPYGVMCNIGLSYPLQLQRIFVDKLDGILLDFYEDGNDYQVYLSEVKPYLRPMSSMTEEERKEYEHLIAFSGNPNGAANFVDWLDKKMFDHRTDDKDKTMTEKGLAIKAPDGMYNLEKK